MPAISALGRSRCGCFISPAIHVTQYHASLVQSTAIIATPKAATGRGTGGTIGVHCGEFVEAINARIGSAASPATFASVNRMLARVPVFTAEEINAAMSAIEIPATICAAETVHVPIGVATDHNVCVVE